LEPRQQVLGLVAVQFGDAAFNMIPTQWLRDDLDHLGVPEHLRFVFPVIKTASGFGLLGGLRWPGLGRVTAVALIAYFVAAMGFHARAKDEVLRYTPAAAMLAWSVAALRAFRLEPTTPNAQASMSRTRGATRVP
jgi:hypothetical protein